MAAMPEQKAAKLLARPAQGMHRIETGAHQVPHRLVAGVRHPNRCQLARAMQPRRADRVPSIRRHPVAGFSWD
jgi:hypothetical protein